MATCTKMSAFHTAYRCKQKKTIDLFENIYVTASKYANKRKLHVHVGYTLIINMCVIIRPITS